MGNRDDRTLGKLLFDQLLDALLCHYIYTCCGFIQHDYFVLTQYGPTYANELSLTSTQVSTLLSYLKVDSPAGSFSLLSHSLCRIELIGWVHA